MWLFIHPWRTSGLFPPFACCEWCCCEHVYTCVCTCIYLNTCFQFSWAYSRSGIVRRSFDATKNCSYTLQVCFISNTVTRTGNSPYRSPHHSPAAVDPSLAPLRCNQTEAWCVSCWCHGATGGRGRFQWQLEDRRLRGKQESSFPGKAQRSRKPGLPSQGVRLYFPSYGQGHQRTTSAPYGRITKGLPFWRLKVWIIFSSKESTDDGAG